MQRRDLLKLSAMLGISAANSSLARAFSAGVSSDSSPAHPFFNDSQRQAVVLLSDMIIPPTNTPGAVDAGVPDFIESIVSEWYRDGERTIFLQGLKDLDAFCRQQGQQSFNNASEQTRIAALQQQEKIAADYEVGKSAEMSFIQSEDEKAPFFKKIKTLVVFGYYTSEVGSKQELIYEPMPMTYDGDVDFSKVGRQWTY